MSEPQYDVGSHWISEQVDAGVFGISHPVAVGAIKFALVWDLLAGLYLLLHWQDASLMFVYASGLGLLWVNLAPFFVWYYDEVVLPGFFERLDELIDDERVRASLAERYSTMFERHRVSVAAFWAVSFVAIVFVSQDALEAQGMVGSGRVFLWTTYAYGLYIGLVMGQGFVGPITTMLLIREVSSHELAVDPLHPDNLGGLGTVGECSIRTTLLFSTASLFLPLLFYFSSAGGEQVLIFGLTGVYIVTILLSFLYPTLTINRRAQEYRDGVLADLRDQYLELEATIGTPENNEISELNKRLELQRVQRTYDNYNSMRLYPLQIGVITRLLGSILLPLLFMLLEFYLPDLL